MRETTALGAAIAAGLAVGLWRNFAELRDINRAGGAVFEPQISKQESRESFAGWERAVRMSKGWVGKTGSEQRETTDRCELALKTASKGREPPSGKIPMSDHRSVDLEELDEEDLLLELRRVEVLQKLKRLRRVRGKL